MFELRTRQDIPDLLLAKLYFFTIRFLSGSVAGKKTIEPRQKYPRKATGIEKRLGYGLKDYFKTVSV